MDEQEKKLREELEKHLDTLRRNLAVVSKEVLKTKYEKPYQEGCYGLHPSRRPWWYPHQAEI